MIAESIGNDARIMAIEYAQYSNPNQSRCCSHGRASPAQGSPRESSLSLSLSRPAGRNRAQTHTAATRDGDRARGFACFASWLRQFVSAATVAGGGAFGTTEPPYTFGPPPRPAPPPPFHPFARRAFPHARLLDSRGRAFSLFRLILPPRPPPRRESLSRELFAFLFPRGPSACIYERARILTEL